MSTRSNVASINTAKKAVKKDVSDKIVADALSVASRTPEKHESEVRVACTRYAANGWKPVLLYKGRKRPVGNEWQHADARNPSDFTGHANIGVALGEQSRGLADVDIDHPALLEAAAYFLPATGAKFGRYYGSGQQKLGHWLYRAPGESTYKLSAPVGEDGKVVNLIEIRSTGGQTVFPPSFIYDSDLFELDLVCWDGGPKSEPPDINTVTDISFEELKSHIKLMAASVFVAHQLGEGSFHDGMISWAGMLAKAGYSEEDAIKSTMWIVDHSGQTDLKNRLEAVSDTYKKVVAGLEESIIGITWFRENLPNEKFVHWLGKLFGVKSGIVDDGRPVVRVVASKEVKLFDDTLEAMVKTQKFYNMSGPIVVINKELDTATGGYTARMTPLVDTTAMQSWLTREVQFVQSVLDKTTMQFSDQPIKAPAAVSTELSNPATFRGSLPQITGLSNIPLITKQGRVVDYEWAYDSELKTFFSCRFPVHRQHADEALKTLMEPFCDFPFAGEVRTLSEEEGLESGEELLGSLLGVTLERYHAAAIAAILSAVVRPAINICPAFVITSSQYSDGKSVMSNAIAAAVGMEGGSPNSPLTRGGSDEEQEKQISSVLAKGKRVVVYDNHDGEFRSAALTETLTSAMPEFRVLGKNEVRTVPNRSVFLINGVNIVLASDLQTRSVFIRLARRDMDVLRKFKHVDVADWCYHNSSKLVSAAVSLIEWALRQDDGSWQASHRFKDWDLLVRRTLILACGVDVSPPAAYDHDREMDPVEEVKNQFLEWVLAKWEHGMRSTRSKYYFCAKDLAGEVAEYSEPDGWVNVLSRRPNNPMEQKIGKCLSMVSGVPFKVGSKVYALQKGLRDKRTGYWVEVIKR